MKAWSAAALYLQYPLMLDRSEVSGAPVNRFRDLIAGFLFSTGPMMVIACLATFIFRLGRCPARGSMKPLVDRNDHLRNAR